MPICHWEAGLLAPLQGHVLVRRIAPKLMTSVLHSHVNSPGAALPAPVLHALVESSAHYLVGLFPRQQLGDCQSILPILLAQIFAKSDRADTPLNRTIAVILAAAAFATNPYPGGEEFSQDLDSCERRALQVLQNYQDNHPGEDLLLALFKFGFIGLMHRLDFTKLGNDSAGMDAMVAVWEKLSSHISTFNHELHSTDIHGLPSTFTLENHMAQAASRCFVAITHDSFSHIAEKAMVSSCLQFLLPESVPQVADTKLYFAALVAFCHAKSDELQNLLLGVLDTQPVPICTSELLQDSGNQSLLTKLWQLSDSTNSRIASTATLHFVLLVASIISSVELSLNDRQAALKPLVELESFTKLQPSITDRSLPSTDVLYVHLRESIGTGNAIEANLRTMQFVIDFCHGEQKEVVSSSDEPPKDVNATSCQGKLQELKNSYRLSLHPIEAPSIAGPPEPNQEPESATQPGAAGSVEFAWLPGLCVGRETV
jgi:hypothetical protein